MGKVIKYLVKLTAEGENFKELRVLENDSSTHLRMEMEMKLSCGYTFYDNELSTFFVLERRNLWDDNGARVDYILKCPVCGRTGTIKIVDLPKGFTLRAQQPTTVAELDCCDLMPSADFLGVDANFLMTSNSGTDVVQYHYSSYFLNDPVTFPGGLSAQPKISHRFQPVSFVHRFYFGD